MSVCLLVALVIPAQAQELSEASQAWLNMKTDADAADAFGIARLKPVSNSEVVPAGKFKKVPPWTIAQAFNGFGNTWRIQIAEEMKYEASLHSDIKDYIFVEAHDDPQRQTAQIQELLEQGIDALIVAPVTTENCNALIAKAVSAGIPVIKMLESSSSPDITVGIDADQWHFGYMAGKWLVEQLRGSGHIWMIRAIPGLAGSMAREQGARAAFEDTDIQVTSEGYGYFTLDKSRQLVEDLLKSDPNWESPACGLPWRCSRGNHCTANICTARPHC